MVNFWSWSIFDHGQFLIMVNFTPWSMFHQGQCLIHYGQCLIMVNVWPGSIFDLDQCLIIVRVWSWSIFGSWSMFHHCQCLIIVLNAAARLILQIHKFSSISSAIRDELHWLPVRSRIVFKQCLLVRSCLAGSAPSYLAELCIPVSSVTGRRQYLRSASRGTLVVPRARTERYGRRGFSVSGPHLWNSLPPRIRSLIEKPDLFKRELKHYLMQQQS